MATLTNKSYFTGRNVGDVGGNKPFATSSPGHASIMNDAGYDSDPSLVAGPSMAGDIDDGPGGGDSVGVGVSSVNEPQGVFGQASSSGTGALRPASSTMQASSTILPALQPMATTHVQPALDGSATML